MSFKAKLEAALRRIVRRTGFDVVRYREFPSDFGPDDVDVISAVRPFTMTSNERLYTLIRAVEYVVRAGVPGEVVECGVWRGGSMMAVAKVLARESCRDRELYLFDTFEGMPEPSAEDVSHLGENASETFEKLRRDAGGSDWCLAALEDVERNVLGVGYDPSKIHFVAGKVEDTIPEKAPPAISLLRLDTDWYASTRHELEHLFPRLSPGGVLLIDDYGFWLGARKATDEYLAEKKLQILLHRIDHTGRVAIKP